MPIPNIGLSFNVSTATDQLTGKFTSIGVVSLPGMVNDTPITMAIIMTKLMAPIRPFLIEFFSVMTI